MSTENAVEQLFNLIRTYYLSGENINNQSRCHESLDYLKEGAKKIKRLNSIKLILLFEKQWRKIKPELKAASNPTKFRLSELEIEKIIKTSKHTVVRV